MYPSAGVIHLAPFSDETLYLETVTKGSFFHQGMLYGVDMSVLHDSAVDEVFRQPVVGLFAPNLLTSSSTAQHVLDFTTVSAEVRAAGGQDLDLLDTHSLGSSLIACAISSGPQELHDPDRLAD